MPSTTHNDQPSSPRAPIEVHCSKGDLALILAGYKTHHFIADAAGFSANQPLVLINGSGADAIRIPVRVCSAEPYHGNAPLDGPALKPYGRPTTRIPSTAERSVSPQTLAKRAANRARESARAFVRALEPPVPEEWYASTISGNTNSIGPLYDVHLRLPLGDNPRAELKQLGKDYTHAYQKLAPCMSEAHRYEFNQSTELNLPPEDPSGLLAMRFLREHYRPVNLEKVLARMRQPYESIAEQLRASTRANHASRKLIPSHSHVEVEGQRIATFPEWYGSTPIETSMGRAALIGMGATSNMAFTAPLDLAEKRNPRGEHRAMLMAAKSNYLGNHSTPVRLDLPVLISCPTETPATQLTDEQARTHGYLSAEGMRRALKIAPDENPTIYSYPVRLAHPYEMDANEQRGTEHYLKLMETVRTAWSSKGDSVRRAELFFKTLPPREHEYCTLRMMPEGQFKKTAFYRDRAPQGENQPLISAGEVKLWLLGPAPEGSVLKKPVDAPRPVGRKPSWRDMKSRGTLAGDGWQVCLTPKNNEGNSR